MKRILQTTTLIAAAALMTAGTASANGYGDAHQKCKKGEDRRQIVGGLLGATAGGILGSQVSGNGARTEGSAIGAVVGGLAGVGIADKTIDCDPVYADGTAYNSGGYSNGGYSNSGYTSSTSYSAPSTSYHNAGYTTTSSQNYYQDQVTTSNHPVYSNPTYGANMNSYGTTYSTGSVAYPPSGHNTQYQTVHGTSPNYSSYSSNTYVAPAPTYQNVTYSQPTTYSYVQPATTYTSSHRPHRSHKRRGMRSGGHFHGKHSCNMHH